MESLAGTLAAKLEDILHACTLRSFYAQPRLCSLTRPSQSHTSDTFSSLVIQHMHNIWTYLDADVQAVHEEPAK